MSNSSPNVFDRKLRNDALLRMAYDQGERQGLTELQMLKVFVVGLLDLKDETFQEKVDELMRSTKPIIGTYHD